MRQTESVLDCQFAVAVVHTDTSSLTSKHSALQWCLSAVSLASSDVTTDAENVFIVRLSCRSRNEVECHWWQTWNWNTDLCNPANIPWLWATCDRRSKADMTNIPQAHWQLGGNVGTGTCRQATCLRASVAHDTVAVHPPQSNDWSSLETFSFRFCVSRFRFSRSVF